MAGPAQRFYEDDEAEQILRLAASMSCSDGRMSHEKLLETAAELGISAEAVESAERQLTRQRRENALVSEFDRHVRREFYSHFTSYVIVMLVLVAVNIWSWTGYFWAMWPIIGWGIGVATHARATFLKSGECYRQEFEKWCNRRDGLENRSPNSQSIRRFEPSVTIGVHVSSRRRERLRRLYAEQSDLRDS